MPLQSVFTEKERILTADEITIEILESFCDECEKLLSNNNIDYSVLCEEVILPVISHLKINKYASEHIAIDNYILMLSSFSKIFSVKERHKSAEYHDKKRCIAFDLLDSFLEGCKQGICPFITNSIHHCIIDISLDKYIELRTYFYGIDHIGTCHNDREEKSKAKIAHLMNCKNNVELNCDIFINDFDEIDGIKKMNTRNRKAFWAYQSNRYDEYGDYINACSFIEKQITFTKNNNAAAYRDLISDNKHIASGFDLFRLCSIRKNCR